MTDRGPSSGGVRTGRIQHALVVAEILLAVVLATGASLLVRTVDQLRAVDLGFDTEGLLVMDVLLPEDQGSEAERAAVHDLLLERGPGIAGVESVVLMNRLPLRDGGYQASITVPGRPEVEGVNRPTALYRPLSPGGLETLGAEIVAGRGLLPTDRAGEPMVAVVNETFARRVWGSEESSLGMTYFTGYFADPVEVVGVVRDMAVTDLVGERPMAAYYAWEQAERGASGSRLVAKVQSGDPTAVSEPLRELILELEPDAAIGQITTMEAAVDAEMAQALRLRFFLGLFSLLGVVLGSVGVYGVVSYSVERRRGELGIRLALGADPGRLLRGVLERGLLPVGMGIAGGTAVALLASGLLDRFLYGVRPVDPVSSLAAAGILLLVGCLASLVPAIRASGTPPAVALRGE